MSVDDVVLTIWHLHSLHRPDCVLTFSFDSICNSLSDTGLPLLYFDQLVSLDCLLMKTRNSQRSWKLSTSSTLILVINWLTR